MNKQIAPIPIFVLLIVSFVAGTVTAQPVETKLIIISPISKTSVNAVAEPFKAYIMSKYGIAVDVQQITGGQPEVYQRIVEWKGKPDADIAWGVEYPFYPDLTSKGLLEPYIGVNFNSVPADFQGLPLKDSQGSWIITSYFSPGIMTNKDLLSRLGLQEPKSWDDMLNAAYRERIVMTTPSKSGGLHFDVELLLQSRGEQAGWAYWRRLAVNVGNWAGRSLEVSSLVEKGEYALGIAIAETSAVLSKKAGFNVGFVYPDPSLFVPSGIAILKGTARPNIAKAFIDYITSKDGQVNELRGGLIPASTELKFSQYPDIPDAAILRDFMKAENVYGIPVKSFPMNYNLYTQRITSVNNIFDDTISKKLDDLRAAWGRIGSAQSKIADFRQKFDELKGKGYDVAAAQPKLTEAEGLVNQAKSSFDSGDYSTASSLASQASQSADSGMALLQTAKPPPPIPYDLTVAAIVIVVIVAFGAYYMRAKSRKKKAA